MPSVNALFSAAPKHEVAHGILCGEALNQNNNQRSRILPLGEAITLRGAAGKRLEATDPSAVPMGSELHRVDDAEFDRFLAALTARTGLVVHVTDQGRTIIKNIAESTLNSAMQTPGRPAQNAANVAIRLEPPFITKLRALVHLLTDPEAKRAENFDVAEHEDDEW